MAENKKSFIAYASWHLMFKELPDELAGKLIKHIFSYVNDENPQSDDFMVNGLFGTIKFQLKEDLKKYQSIVERNRKNGVKGGRPKNPNKPTGINENPNKPDNDNDNDNVFSKENNIESNKLDSTPDKPKIVIVPYQEIANHYNNICVKLSRCIKLTDSRKTAIKARYKEHGEDSVFSVLNIVSKSSFLNGENDRNWKADFDWIFKPTNFIKILEGNYNNKTSKYDWTQRKNN